MGSSKTLTKPAVRAVVAFVIMACTAWVARAYWAKRQLILAENHAVGLQNQEQYAQALAAYEELLPRTGGEQALRLRGNLAACYVALAENPALSAREGMELYRKAYTLDPKAVTNPAILKQLQRRQ